MVLKTQLHYIPVAKNWKTGHKYPVYKSNTQNTILKMKEKTHRRPLLDKNLSQWNKTLLLPKLDWRTLEDIPKMLIFLKSICCSHSVNQNIRVHFSKEIS